MTTASSSLLDALLQDHSDVRSDVALELIFEALSKGHPQTMIAHGHSMGASLPSGSQVLLTPAREIRLGQVIALFEPHQPFLIHRVVGLRRDGAFLLKGDANPEPDGWFSPQAMRAGVYAYKWDNRWKHPTYTPLPPVSMWLRMQRKAARAARDILSSR